VGPEVAIISKIPKALVFRVLANPHKLHESIRFVHEGPAIRANVDRSVSTYCNNASSNLGARRATTEATNFGEQLQASTTLPVVGEVFFSLTKVAVVVRIAIGPRI